MKNILKAQARSRAAVEEAVRGWVGLAGATAQDRTFSFDAVTRDRTPVEVIVTVSYFPTGESYFPKGER